MFKNILSLALLLVSIFLSLRHGWSSLNYRKNPESMKMLTALGMNERYVPAMGAALILIAFLLMFPRTFLVGNILNAFSILTIMALALNSGNYRIALMEIPFLILPLVLIALRYPFSTQAAV